MSSRRVCLLLICSATLAAGSAANAQALVPPWGDWLKSLLAEYQQCDKGANEAHPTACNVFLARALEKIYGVKEFKKSDDTYETANEIADDVLISDAWERIGTADDASVLATATEDANHNVAVIAVWKNPDKAKHGHVAIILPGPTSETSWGKTTPNSASFFLNKDPDQSYIGLPLSRAFTKAVRGSVLIYRRKAKK